MRSFRFVLIALPLSFIVATAAQLIWGGNGVLARQALVDKTREVRSELADVELENQRLLREINAVRHDPVVMERLIADELGWGREGDILVRFD